jgi:hypothetical protein
MPNPAHGFGPTPAGDTNLNRVQNAVKQALDTLAENIQKAVDAMGLSTKQTVWQTVGVKTRDQLRRLRGDADGVVGPRSIILSGTSTPMDAGRAVYIWDPASSAADNGTTVIAVSGVSAGRWRTL